MDNGNHSNSLSLKYAAAHAKRVEYYNNLLKDTCDDSGKPTYPFWDAVVLTAGDDSQKAIYEGIVASLLEGGNLPSRGTKWVGR